MLLSLERQEQVLLSVLLSLERQEQVLLSVLLSVLLLVLLSVLLSLSVDLLQEDAALCHSEVISPYTLTRTRNHSTLAASPLPP